MPSVNILTWNSRGESHAKAQALQALITLNPNVPGWAPDIILIQEARAQQGGDIFAMLNTLAGNYANNPAQHVTLAQEGYILKLSNNAAFAPAGAFTALNLAIDPGVLQAIHAFQTPQTRAQALQEVANMRRPAHTIIQFPINQPQPARNIDLLTWHAPIGPGALLPGIAHNVDYDAYYFLQNSDYYRNTLLNPGPNNLSLVAGDLNVTDVDLTSPTQAQGIPYLFPNWVGRSSNLDHVLAIGNGGAAAGITFTNAYSDYIAGSDHWAMACTVTWQ